MKCDRETCIFLVHTDLNNNGGTHCCFGCKTNGRHGPVCQRKQILENNCVLRIQKCIPTELRPRASGRSYFTGTEVAQIYGFPAPSGTATTVIGVLSFGGGLYGSVDSNGVLTNGDVQKYWGSLGIPSANYPKVIIVGVNGAVNTPNPNDRGATYENTLDIETIGACMPTSNLVIILFLGRPTSSMLSVFNAAMNGVTINSVAYKPNIISISWGMAEVYMSASTLNATNAAFAAAAEAGITICTATGDNGSNNGVGGTGNYVDFPSSSPFCTAVGGTSLVCVNNTYTVAPNTIETAWSYGGGGVSKMFTKPSWQSVNTDTGRAIPDIALVADPNTGVYFLVNNTGMVFGGTSIAAPAAAAFFALCNVKTFINPILYSAPKNCFYDITSGNNGGYKTKSGYDNCTGLGSINGVKLAELLTKPINTTLGSPYIVGNKYTIITSTNPMPMTWSSSNPTLATVDNNGVVTALSPGTVNITCTTIGSTATLPINIITRVAVTSITLNPPGPLTKSRISATKITGNVMPAGATNKALTWTSTNPAVATVNPNGVVTGISAGTASIICRSVDTPSVAATAVFKFT